MTHSLPTIISDYMAASDSGNVDAIVACFTDDAVVVDEDQEWRGRPKIREWRERVATAYEYTVEAWTDTFRGWQHEFAAKFEAGIADLRSETLEGAALLDEAASAS